MTRELALVSMPFGSTRLPSIQIGLLTAMAADRGWRAQGVYGNLAFAGLFGWERYERLCRQQFRLLGEWLFSVAAFADAAPDETLFLDRSDLAGIEAELGLDRAALLAWRNETIPRFIHDLADQPLWAGLTAVGFTSMFEQTCASLALARALKRRRPELITLFGGANFDGGMGVEFLRSLDCVDIVVAGEAEQVFPLLLDQLAGDVDTSPLPGVHRRGGPAPDQARTPTVEAMDEAPIPDYRDFFQAIIRNGAPREIEGQWISVPFESARGCWWGETSHCTFCGLNAMGMAYRSKSPARVLAELDELSDRHGQRSFFAVDNILDHRYIDQVFGALERRELDYGFWYETKANIKPEQIKALANGGLVWVQPGIESLNTRILKLMGKGSTSFINLRFLKWAHYYQIKVAWNVLYGFPGETEEDYQQLLGLMERIGHLPPPDDCGEIRMDRFSPYHSQPERWGLTQVRPDARYAAVYPTAIDAEKIAYYFDFHNPHRLPDTVYEPMRQRIAAWQAAWSDPQTAPELTYTRSASQIRFVDTRHGSTPQAAFYDRLGSAIYPMISRTYLSVGQVHKRLAAEGAEVTARAVDNIFEEFEKDGLIWREGETVTGLGLPSSKRF
jgi:ribosomal peptide maturation radical SAM protein 1